MKARLLFASGVYLDGDLVTAAWHERYYFKFIKSPDNSFDQSLNMIGEAIHETEDAAIQDFKRYGEILED